MAPMFVLIRALGANFGQYFRTTLPPDFGLLATSRSTWRPSGDESGPSTESVHAWRVASAGFESGAPLLDPRAAPLPLPPAWVAAVGVCATIASSDSTAGHASYWPPAQASQAAAPAPAAAVSVSTGLGPPPTSTATPTSIVSAVASWPTLIGPTSDEFGPIWADARQIQPTFGQL